VDGEVGLDGTGNVEAGRKMEEVAVVVEENEELKKQEKGARGKMSIHSSASTVSFIPSCSSSSFSSS
jgi:hypothetical protein